MREKKSKTMERERKEIGKKNDEGCSRVREKRGEKEAEGHRVTGKDESERERDRGNERKREGDNRIGSLFLSLCILKTDL